MELTVTKGEWKYMGKGKEPLSVTKTVTLHTADFLHKNCLEYAECELENGNPAVFQICVDVYPENPREDFDCLGTLVCKHRRYDLSDKSTDDEKLDADDLPTEYEKAKGGEGNFIILPVYMLDHSGLRVSTEPFGDPWDSGLLGFVYVSKKKAAKWAGVSVGDLKAQERRKSIEEALRQEIRVFSDYLQGNVYALMVTDMVTDETDSLCGVYLGESEHDKRQYITDMAKDFGVKAPEEMYKNLELNAY